MGLKDLTRDTIGKVQPKTTLIEFEAKIASPNLKVTKAKSDDNIDISQSDIDNAIKNNSFVDGIFKNANYLRDAENEDAEGNKSKFLFVSNKAIEDLYNKDNKNSIKNNFSNDFDKLLKNIKLEKDNLKFKLTTKLEGKTFQSSNFFITAFSALSPSGSNNPFNDALYEKKFTSEFSFNLNEPNIVYDVYNESDEQVITIKKGQNKLIDDLFKLKDDMLKIFSNNQNDVAQQNNQNANNNQSNDQTQTNDRQDFLTAVCSDYYDRALNELKDFFKFAQSQLLATRNNKNSNELVKIIEESFKKAIFYLFKYGRSYTHENSSFKNIIKKINKGNIFNDAETSFINFFLKMTQNWLYDYILYISYNSTFLYFMKPDEKNKFLIPDDIFDGNILTDKNAFSQASQSGFELAKKIKSLDEMKEIKDASERIAYKYTENYMITNIATFSLALTDDSKSITFKIEINSKSEIDQIKISEIKLKGAMQNSQVNEINITNDVIRNIYKLFISDFINKMKSDFFAPPSSFELDTNDIKSDSDVSNTEDKNIDQKTADKSSENTEDQKNNQKDANDIEKSNEEEIFDYSDLKGIFKDVDIEIPYDNIDKSALFQKINSDLSKIDYSDNDNLKRYFVKLDEFKSDLTIHMMHYTLKVEEENTKTFIDFYKTNDLEYNSKVHNGFRISVDLVLNSKVINLAFFFDFKDKEIQSKFLAAKSNEILYDYNYSLEFFKFFVEKLKEELNKKIEETNIDNSNSNESSTQAQNSSRLRINGQKIILEEIQKSNMQENVFDFSYFKSQKRELEETIKQYQKEENDKQKKILYKKAKIQKEKLSNQINVQIFKSLIEKIKSLRNSNDKDSQILIKGMSKRLGFEPNPLEFSLQSLNRFKNMTEFSRIVSNIILTNILLQLSELNTIYLIFSNEKIDEKLITDSFSQLENDFKRLVLSLQNKEVIKKFEKVIDEIEKNFGIDSSIYKDVKDINEKVINFYQKQFKGIKDFKQSFMQFWESYSKIEKIEEKNKERIKMIDSFLEIKDGKELKQIYSIYFMNNKFFNENLIKINQENSKLPYNKILESNGYQTFDEIYQLEKRNFDKTFKRCNETLGKRPGQGKLGQLFEDLQEIKNNLENFKPSKEDNQEKSNETQNSQDKQETDLNKNNKPETGNKQDKTEETSGNKTESKKIKQGLKLLNNSTELKIYQRKK